MEELKVNQFSASESLENESVSMNNLNIDSSNSDNLDKVSSQISQEDIDESGSMPSYQKIIKINLLSEDVRNISIEDPSKDIMKKVHEKNASEESIADTKVINESSSEDFSNENISTEKETLIKRSTSDIKDLIEEGKDLNAKEDIETKLESIYENGRVVEDQDNFEVILNVKRFMNGSMSVKSKGHHIFLVEAQADNVNDPGSNIYLTRRFFIPGRINMQKTTTALSSDGILVISVPKLPELKIPKRSEDVSTEKKDSLSSSETNISMDTKSSPVKHDLESRFRNSSDKIRTESPSKLEELEARIKARKEMSEQTNILDEKSRRKNENDTQDTREKEEVEYSGVSSKKHDEGERFRTDKEDQSGYSSRFRSSEDDFFNDRDWNTREKKDSKDWIRDYVGKYVDTDDWFGSNRTDKDRDFFDTDRRRQDSNKRRESRREWMNKLEDTMFDTKDVFGTTKREDFFGDYDEDDKFFGRHNRRSDAKDFFDSAFSKTRGDEFKVRNRNSDQSDSYDERAKKDSGAGQKMFSSSETRRQYSSSTSTDNKNHPETERKESFSKQEFSSSSHNKTTKDDFDREFPSSRDNSEARRKDVDDIREEFMKESDFSFDFPIVRRGRFFQDSFFNDTKEDFDSVLDRFRDRKQRLNAKDDTEFERYSTNIRQQNKKQKTVISEDDTCFKIELPMEGIKEDTLTVKELEGNEILIEGKMKNEDGIFRKHIMFPIHGDFQKAKSFLAADGVLIIKVPKINTH